MRAKILLSVGSVVFTLLVLELLLGRFLPQRTMNHVLSNRAGVYRASDVVLAELIPNVSAREREHEGEFDYAVQINSLGYRQAEFNPAKTDQLRIVTIGDSFTFGDGVEEQETWPRALERALAGQAPRRIEVINAGVPGRWVDEYYLELKRRSLPLDPDVVIVGLFIGNDIDGDDATTHIWSEVDERGRPLRIDRPAERIERGYRVMRVLKARWRFPVIRNSHVAQLFYDGGKALAQLWRPSAIDGETMFAAQYTPETERAVERVEDLFVAMAELCRAHGAKLLVVMIPTREQVKPELVDGSVPRDWEKPQRLFAAFFAREGIPYVDLIPVLREAASGDPLYYVFDGHWTARGHAVAAHAIAAHLVDAGFGRAPAQLAVGSPDCAVSSRLGSTCRKAYASWSGGRFPITWSVRPVGAHS